jgi:hypothetical protein
LPQVPEQQVLQQQQQHEGVAAGPGVVGAQLEPGAAVMAELLADGEVQPSKKKKSLLGRAGKKLSKLFKGKSSSSSSSKGKGVDVKQEFGAVGGGVNEQGMGISRTVKEEEGGEETGEDEGEESGSEAGRAEQEDVMQLEQRVSSFTLCSQAPDINKLLLNRNGSLNRREMERGLGTLGNGAAGEGNTAATAAAGVTGGSGGGDAGAMQVGHRRGNSFSFLKTPSFGRSWLGLKGGKEGAGGGVGMVKEEGAQQQQQQLPLEKGMESSGSLGVLVPQGTVGVRAGLVCGKDAWDSGVPSPARSAGGDSAGMSDSLGMDIDRVLKQSKGTAAAAVAAVAGCGGGEVGVKVEGQQQLQQQQLVGEVQEEHGEEVTQPLRGRVQAVAAGACQLVPMGAGVTTVLPGHVAVQQGAGTASLGTVVGAVGQPVYNQSASAAAATPAALGEVCGVPCGGLAGAGDSGVTEAQLAAIDEELMDIIPETMLIEVAGSNSGVVPSVLGGGALPTMACVPGTASVGMVAPYQQHQQQGIDAAWVQQQQFLQQQLLQQQVLRQQQQERWQQQQQQQQEEELLLQQVLTPSVSAVAAQQRQQQPWIQ